MLKCVTNQIIKSLKKYIISFLQRSYRKARTEIIEALAKNLLQQLPYVARFHQQSESHAIDDFLNWVMSLCSESSDCICTTTISSLLKQIHIMSLLSGLRQIAYIIMLTATW